MEKIKRVGFFMKEKLCGRFVQSSGEDIDYDMIVEYYLTEQRLFCNRADLVRYGVAIRKLSLFDDGSCERLSRSMNCIFYKREEAERFIEKLIGGKVTPLTLREITEEYISGQLDFCDM